MTSPYITAAVAACRLPVKVECVPATVSYGIMASPYSTEDYGFVINAGRVVYMSVGAKGATRAYTALRNRLLRENEG